MPGKMCWLSLSGAKGQKVLHLQTEGNQPWQPYTNFPHLTVPDYEFFGCSPGLATYQKLFKAGWVVVSAAEAGR